MIKYTLLILFSALSLGTINAEELIWFSLECNLKNADIIVQAEIIDTQGNLKIEKYYKGESYNLNIINLNEYAIHEEERFDNSFPKAIGKKLILFIDISEELELQPAFFSWGLSCLWMTDLSYWGLIQRENPGGYELYPYIKNETQLKLKVNNWKYLELAINNANGIELAEDRIDYLIEIFNWHPFKEDILLRLAIEDELSTKKIEDLIWKIFSHKYLSKSELYPCGLLEYGEENYMQLVFRLHKSITGNQYERSISKVIRSMKNHINYMEHRESADLNEAFVIELLKFLKVNPVNSWEADKAEINRIINENKIYYNQLFFTAMRQEINLN